MKTLNICISTLLLSSCSTPEKSIGLGAAIGGSIGGAIGNQSGSGGQRDASTIQGLAIGAALGSLIGYAGYAGKKETKAKPDLRVEPLGQMPQGPSLSAPKVRRVWVPAQIEGDKYIDGHFVYVIEKTSQWSQ